jgi:hypothetical protein
MISIDLESGLVLVGQTSIAVRLTEDEGYLHLNYPDGPVLRPLSVLERLRLVQYALTAENPPAVLAASILHAATVKAGVGDTRLYEAVALHLAGGGLQAPPIYQTISTVAQHTGWHPDQIFSADAAQIDHMAIALTPADLSEWTRVIMIEAGQDELGAYANDLAASLIGRLDDSAGAIHSAAGSNSDPGPLMDKARGLPDPLKALNSPHKRTSTNAVAFQTKIRPHQNQTGGSQSSTSDRPLDSPSSLEPPDIKSSRESTPAGMDQSTNMSPSDRMKRKHDETSPETKKGYSSDDGFILKKANGRERRKSSLRWLGSMGKDANPAGEVEAVARSYRSEAKKAGGLSDPDNSSAPLSYTGEKGEHDLTLQRQMAPDGNFGRGGNSSPTGVRTEPSPLPHPDGDPAATDQIFSGRPRLARQAPAPGSHDWPTISRRHTAMRLADGSDQAIEAFLGHRQTSVAEELADSLNREADLRGIE